MGQLTAPKPVKLIIGIICNDSELIDKVLLQLEGLYGKIDSKSDLMDFDKTIYYNEEMGQGLKKIFVSFEKLIKPEDIIDIKLKTNEIEDSLTYHNTSNRRINLDPGYISAANLILATTKDFSHRIYLGRGIFAEVTLIYSKGRYNILDWTFPDFRQEKYHRYFIKVREIYFRGF